MPSLSLGVSYPTRAQRTPRRCSRASWSSRSTLVARFRRLGVEIFVGTAVTKQVGERFPRCERGPRKLGHTGRSHGFGYLWVGTPRPRLSLQDQVRTHAGCADTPDPFGVLGPQRLEVEVLGPS